MVRTCSRRTSSELKALRRDMQIIFQDPYSSLDPRMKIGESVGLPLYVHGMKNAKQRREIVVTMLQKVGLEAYHLNHLPARVFRRAAPTGWYRPRPNPQSKIHRLRRACLRAGCLDRIPNPELVIRSIRTSLG